MPCLYNRFVTCNSFSKSRNPHQRLTSGEQRTGTASGEGSADGGVGSRSNQNREVGHSGWTYALACQPR